MIHAMITAKLNRVISLAVAVVFFVAVQFSLIFVSAEAMHDCCDEECCPVCEMIAVCEGVLKTAAHAIAIIAVAIIGIAVINQTKILPQLAVRNISLISLKTKFSN